MLDYFSSKIQQQYMTQVTKLQETSHSVLLHSQHECTDVAHGGTQLV
jgi:hypothetical protein